MDTHLRVAIVEDDDRLREDFIRMVDSGDGMSCAAAFASAEDAIAGLGPARPDVVLVDINLPGMTGIDLVRRLRAEGGAMHVLMLTTFDDATSVFESLKAGANGYLLKRAALADLGGAIRDVASGGAPMTGAIARKVVQYFTRRPPAPEVETLTDRERQVLDALSRGEQYKEIAAALGISINTVRNYIRAIYDKLHVHTRLDAIQKLNGA